jgi:hypothetical protein
MTTYLYNTWLAINNNDITGYGDLIIGDVNTLHLTNSNIVGGTNHVYGDNDIIIGNNNTVFGNFSVASGVNNHVTGYKDVVLGNVNLLYGDAGQMTGDLNLVEGNNETVVGDANQIFFDAKEFVPNNTSVQGIHNQITVGGNEHLSLVGDSNTIHVMGSAKIDLTAVNNSEVLDFMHCLDSGNLGIATVSHVNHNDSIVIAPGDTFTMHSFSSPKGQGIDIQITHPLAPTFDVVLMGATESDIHIVHSLTQG